MSVANYFSLLPPRDRGIPELDGLRGIAILLVLFRHGTEPLYHAGIPLLPIFGWEGATPFLNGWTGVDLFFNLSGFLITYHLLSSWPENFDRQFVYRFWFKRGLRVFPAYYAVLAIVAFGLIPFYNAKGNSFDLSAHLLFLQDYFGAPYVTAFWSLGVEIKFYLLAPLFVGLLRRIGSPTWRGVILIALSLFPLLLRLSHIADEEPTTYYQFFWDNRAPFHMALEGFWFGALAAFLYRDSGAWSTEAKRIIGGGAQLIGWGGAVAILLPFDLLRSDSWTLVSIDIYLVSLSFGLILFGSIIHPTPVRPFLGAAPLRFLATVSYSLYLIHQPCIPMTRHLLDRLAIAPPTGAIYWGLFLLLFGVLSIGAAAILHLIVEKPFLALKDRLDLRRGHPLFRPSS